MPKVATFQKWQPYRSSDFKSDFPSCYNGNDGVQQAYQTDPRFIF